MLRGSNFPRTQGRRVEPRAGDQAHEPHMEAIADAALDGTRKTLLTTGLGVVDGRSRISYRP